MFVLDTRSIAGTGNINEAMEKIGFIESLLRIDGDLTFKNKVKLRCLKAVVEGKHEITIDRDDCLYTGLLLNSLMEQVENY